MLCVRPSVLVYCLVFAGFTPGLFADEAEDKAVALFNSLFGSDIERVTKTRDRTDDVELAQRLLEAARQDSAGKPALVVVLCEKAAELAEGHPDGYVTALAAMELLIESAPERAGACAVGVLAIRQKQYERARGEAKVVAADALIDALLDMADSQEASDDLSAAAATCRRAEATARAMKIPWHASIEVRAKRLARLVKAGGEIDGLKAALAKDPGDAAARERLVRLCLVDLDDPVKAAEHVEGVADASLRKYVTAAAKGVEAPPELACLELGNWYRSLGNDATEDGKAAMLARAELYYERFLDVHAAANLDRAGATMALRKVEAELERLGRPPVGSPASAADASAQTVKPGQWVELIGLIDPKRDTVSGTWQRRGRSLALSSPAEQNRAAAPIAPAGSYTLDARFVRVSGDDTVCFVLPVGSRSISVFFSAWQSAVHGLSDVKGQDARSNETGVKPGILRNGVTYRACMTVKVRGERARITVRLNNKPLIAWEGPLTDLSPQTSWASPRPGQPAFGTSHSDAVFRSVRLRMLSG
ncbi:MAG TPA: hypothetical protein VM238_16355, partial [Phycisphaerae bacterium]|nr:hypothetical protein [Phycisphaerae bacterium]